jgi:hypothetical protein
MRVGHMMTRTIVKIPKFPCGATGDVHPSRVINLLSQRLRMSFDPAPRALS